MQMGQKKKVNKVHKMHFHMSLTQHIIDNVVNN